MKAANRRRGCRWAVTSAIVLGAIYGTAQAQTSDTNQYYYDTLGRLIGSTAYIGQETAYVYDSSDNRSSLTTLPTVPAGTHTMSSGQVLLQGQTMSSPDGRTALIFQHDHNLFLSQSGTNYWWTNTFGQYPAAAVLYLAPTGELALLDAQLRTRLWTTNTTSYSGQTLLLSLQNGGNLVLTANGATIWQTNTGGR